MWIPVLFEIALYQSNPKYSWRHENERTRKRRSCANPTFLTRDLTASEIDGFIVGEKTKRPEGRMFID
jgi:hypothetical protein